MNPKGNPMEPIFYNKVEKWAKDGKHQRQENEKNPNTQDLETTTWRLKSVIHATKNSYGKL